MRRRSTSIVTATTLPKFVIGKYQGLLVSHVLPPDLQSTDFSSVDNVFPGDTPRFIVSDKKGFYIIACAKSAYSTTNFRTFTKLDIPLSVVYYITGLCYCDPEDKFYMSLNQRYAGDLCCHTIFTYTKGGEFVVSWDEPSLGASYSLSDYSRYMRTSAIKLLNNTLLVHFYKSNTTNRQVYVGTRYLTHNEFTTKQINALEYDLLGFGFIGNLMYFFYGQLGGATQNRAYGSTPTNISSTNNTSYLGAYGVLVDNYSSFTFIGDATIVSGDMRIGTSTSYSVIQNYLSIGAWDNILAGYSDDNFRYILLKANDRVRLAYGTNNTTFDNTKLIEIGDSNDLLSPVNAEIGLTALYTVEQYEN